MIFPGHGIFLGDMVKLRDMLKLGDWLKLGKLQISFRRAGSVSGSMHQCQSIPTQTRTIHTKFHKNRCITF